MKAYRAVLGARARTLLQYRAAAIAGLVTQFFFGLVRTAVFVSFYATSASPQPMDWPQTLTYIWLGQTFFRLLPFGPDPEVRSMVRNGTVAYELTRPLDLYNLWYARAVSGLIAPVLLRMFPVAAFAMVFMGMRAPASAASGALFAASILCGVLLGAAFVNLLSISLLWTISGEGAARMTNVAIWCLSGITLPVLFFPDWAQPLLEALPFRALMDTPFRLYMGQIPPEQAPGAIAHQILWIALIVFAGRALLARGICKLTVQGG